MLGLRFAASVALTLSLILPGRAESPGGGTIPGQWAEQFVQARRLCQTGDFSKATEVYSELIRALKADNAPTEFVARAYDEMAISQKVNGQLADAEKNYLRALELMERVDGHSGSRVGVILSDLGAYYIEVGQIPRAEHYLTESRDVLAGAKSVPSYCRAAAMENLAALYFQQGQMSRAEEQFRDAMELLIKGSPEDQPQLAVVLGDLSQVLVSEGHAEQAQTYLAESLRIFDALPGRFRSNQFAVLVISANADRVAGDLAKAEATCDRAVALGDEALGPENPRLVGELDVCSVVYKARHRKKDAKLLASRSAGIKTEIAAHLSGAKTVDLATLVKENAH